MVVKNFNTSDPVPTAETSIPEGRYTAILWSDWKTVSKKNPDNIVIHMLFKIIDGEHKGHTIFHMNNFLNVSPVASAMGQRELLDLTNSVNFKGSIVFDSAIEKLNAPSLSEIYNKPLEIQIVLEDNLDFGVQNKIKGFFPCVQNVPSKPRTEDTSFKTDTSKDLTNGWGARTN